MSCPDCFTGHVHAGTPTGSEITLAGLPTYVSRPQNGGEPKGVVLFIPDIFGWAFVNSRLLCDAYAEKGGFVVYLPDLMGGRAPPFEFSALIDKIKNPASWTITLLWKPIWVFQAASLLIPFFATNRQSVVLSRIINIITAIRASPDNSALKVGAAGFCWGGKYVFLLANDKPSSRISVNGSLQPLIDCAFTAHPSMLSVPADVENVRQPMSVAVGDTDMALSPEGIRTMETILKKKGEDHEVVILDGAKHGFGVRLDPKDELQNKYADVAEKQAIAWFTKWLAK